MSKRILIAPANYKGSISPEDAALSILKGINDVSKNAEASILPLSDGGEGFMKSLVSAVGGKVIKAEVVGPLHDKVMSYFGMLDKNTAVVEMALASGLELITEQERDPWNATTYGTGELILEAIRNGASKIIVGLGGSATNDGGLGMIQALGAKAINHEGNAVPMGALGLEQVERLDLTQLDNNIKGVTFIAACDVTNPLLGENGASAVYGPQKGADEVLVNRLDGALSHFNHVIEKKLERYNAKLFGVGAAGGLGYGLVTFMNAELRSGFDIVAELTDLENKVEWADLIITGEGKIDDQTLQGKTVYRLAALAQKYRKRLVAFGGAVDYDLAKEFNHIGIGQLHAIIDLAEDVEDAMKNASHYLTKMAQTIIKQ